GGRELWGEGMDAGTVAMVALTISPMRAAPDWVASIRERLADDEVVAGAIEPGEGLRIVDWAEYFCRYARDMLPFERRENPEIPGDNCAHPRGAPQRPARPRPRGRLGARGDTRPPRRRGAGRPPP